MLCLLGDFFVLLKGLKGCCEVGLFLKQLSLQLLMCSGRDGVCSHRCRRDCWSCRAKLDYSHILYVDGMISFTVSTFSDAAANYLTLCELFCLHSPLEGLFQLSSNLGCSLLSIHHRFKGAKLMVFLPEAEVLRCISSHLWVMFNLKGAQVRTQEMTMNRFNCTSWS